MLHLMHRAMRAWSRGVWRPRGDASASAWSRSVPTSDQFAPRSSFVERPGTRPVNGNVNANVIGCEVPRPTRPSIRNDRNIGQAEIGPDKEEGLAERSRERVGEAIAEVQARGVAPLAVAAEGGTGELRMVRRDGDGLGAEAAKQNVQVAFTRIPEPPLDHDARLYDRRGRDPS